MLRTSSLLFPRISAVLRTTAVALGLTLLPATQGLAQQQILKVTTIPEEAATEQIRKFGPITRYL